MRQKEFDKLTQEMMAQGLDFIERVIPYQGGSVNIYFISQLTDRDFLTQNVIRPLILFCASAREAVTAKRTANELIFADEITFETDYENAQNHILAGKTVLLFSTDKEYLVINCKMVAHRSVPKPELNYALGGPQDCFNENLDTNISLLRYRMKDKNLRIQYMKVGERTKTVVAVVYIQDIANDALVNQIVSNIQNIKIDGIATLGELRPFLVSNAYSVFPQLGLFERSDIAYHILLDGKVIILMDGSNNAIYAPKVFSEYFMSSDDRYGNKVFGFFSRMFRYLSLVVALTGSSIYVAVSSFHTDVLPTDYAILLATLRNNTPLTALIGALLIEMIMELLRESLLRVPKHIGSAIGIVGAIVVGQAAIAAGIFSSLLLIIAAVSLLASFAIPDYTLVTPFRYLKFFMILATGFLGFYGFTIVAITILTLLVSNTSFGVPFMTPFAPYSKGDLSSALMDKSNNSKWRPRYLQDKDKKRMP